MPSFTSFSRILGTSGITAGQARKMDSDMIMEATWDRDIQSRVAYFYDYYHDSEPTKLRNLNSANDPKKIPIDIKYIVSSSQTYDKDPVTYHIQFKPSHICGVNYYKEMFEDRYGGIYPCGLYVDIPDNKGNYNRWLVVDKANFYDPQFSTFEVLPCDYVFQWIHEGHRHEMAGVLRSQNSYNSGLWEDFKIVSPEDQQKFIVPLNVISEHIYYDQRMIIDAPVTSREPNAWLVSKIKSFAPNCLNRITLAQDRFDQHHDYIEKDSTGKAIGMWADYFTDEVPIHDSNDPVIKSYKSEILYSGLKPEIKVGGSYKTFTMNYYDDTGELITNMKYDWKFELDHSSIPEGIVKVLYPDKTNKLENNQIKIKFIGSDDYLNSILTVKNEYSELNVKIVGM